MVDLPAPSACLAHEKPVRGDICGGQGGQLKAVEQNRANRHVHKLNLQVRCHPCFAETLSSQIWGKDRKLLGDGEDLERLMNT